MHGTTLCVAQRRSERGATIETIRESICRYADGRSALRAAGVL